MKFKIFCLSVIFLIGAGVSICPAADTHMGVEPANFVTLQWECVEPICHFLSFGPDGSYQGYFQIPDRMVFVVTEFDWRFKGEPSSILGPDGDMLSFSLRRGGSDLHFHSPVSSYAFTKTVTCGDSVFCFIASGSEQMTTGFVVVQGTKLEPRMRNAATGQELSNGSLFLTVKVRGYLVEPSCGVYDLPPCTGR